ncbi:MAG: RnfABCDGE type electron transport complex subunit D, partial [Proteobacteria bacterium]|nr:RnfABCDGE type electron transport complex subunit D [Pseudomonadota bacterium]
MSAPLNTSGSPHIPARFSVTKVMGWVLVALIPAIFAHLYFFGIGLVVQMILATTTGYIFEWWCLSWRKQPLQPFLTDLTVPVTAVLFALCLSPIAPWYVAVVGMFFAIVVAKHLYGGLGNNIFNPAMVAFATILVAFPQSMSLWLPPAGLTAFGGDLHTIDWQQVISIIFLGLPVDLSVDAVTAATPLTALKTGLQQGFAQSEIIVGDVFGDFGGLGWEWIANWLFLGGLFLLFKRIITWHVPAAVLMTTIAASTPFYLFNADLYM